jgi:peptidoglycan/LPS O-acetylase OafA/YrhL
MFPTWVYGAFLTNFWLAITNSWDWLPLSVLWSLAVEEQFYVVAPWVMRAIPERGIPLLLGALALSAELMRVCFISLFPERLIAAHVLTPLRMDSLALGVMVAWIVRSPQAESFLLRFGAHWRLWFGLCAAMIGGLDLLQTPVGSRDFVVFGYLIISFSAAIVVLIVAKIRPKGLCGCLEWRPLVHLGRRAYFIYLWHGVLGQSLILYFGGPDFTLNSIEGFAIVASAVAVTWGAAAVSWRWFEGPIVGWGQKHAY